MARGFVATVKAAVNDSGKPHLGSPAVLLLTIFIQWL